MLEIVQFLLSTKECSKVEILVVLFFSAGTKLSGQDLGRETRTSLGIRFAFATNKNSMMSAFFKDSVSGVLLFFFCFFF